MVRDSFAIMRFDARHEPWDLFIFLHVLYMETTISLCTYKKYIR